jgi:Tol biopolymer transport system component
MRFVGARIAAAVVLAGMLGTAANAGVLRQLTRMRVETFSDETSYSNFAVDDAGTFVVTASTEDTGANPNNEPRLVGFTLPAGLRAEIVPFPVLIGNTSVSDDGQWIAFVSAANPVGQNPDGSLEAFLASRDGTTIRQLTNRSSFSAPNPRPVLTGSANRVLFVDTGNPLGANPAGLEQLFVIDASGSNLRQLTTVADPAKSFCAPFVPYPPTHSVDDAGRHAVFTHNGNLTGANPSGKCQLYRIGTDGSLLAQITSGNADSIWPVLSGNGNKAVYLVQGTGALQVVDWSTAVSTALIAGWDPTITDDAQWVYYEDDGQLFKVAATGGATSQITVEPPYVDEAEVSGSNTALVLGADGGELPGGNNPDGSLELWVTNISGGGAQQLTHNDEALSIYDPYPFDPDITPDGSRIVFIGPGNEIFRVNADGSNAMRLSFPSSGETGAEHLSVAADGDSIVFESWVLTPLNNPRVYALRENGTELFQLAELTARPVLGKTSNLAVLQGPSAGALLKVLADTPGATQFTTDGSNLPKYQRLDYDADWVVYNSNANPLGTNADGSIEIFRVRTDGSGLQQLTSAPSSASGISTTPDISADGNRVVFASTTNPVGLNPDGNEEIFLLDVPTNTTQQLTVTTTPSLDGFPTMPRISGNGEYVFFESPAPYFAYPSALYRMEIASGTIERCDGMPYQPLGALVQWNYTAGLAVDYSGERVAFVGFINGAGKNGDGSDELFLADFAATPQWTISKSQPTVLSFEPDPRGVRYDVLRGDLANLAPGAGGTVDLGPVVCLENDSWDASTAGFGDPTLPAPGQGFFFLFRFTQGPPDGTGSWGQGTGSAERVPGFGACAD